MSYHLCEPDPAVAETVSRWLVDEVGRPHPDLGREGPVCPFVMPALKTGSLTVRQHHWRGPHEVSEMVALIAEIVDRFRYWEPPGRRDLHAAVVVVAGLPRARWWLVDQAHRRAKHLAVAKGYMVGQFHPDCAEPSIHNRSFAVNTAPYPLFAVRRMAVHDLLFLHDDPIWFQRYCALFGHRYTAGGRVNEHLRELYEQTCRRYHGAGLAPAREAVDTQTHEELSWKSN